MTYLNRGQEDIALGYIQKAANLDFPEAILKYHELTNEPIPEEQKKFVKQIKSTIEEDFPSICNSSSSQKSGKIQSVTTGNPKVDDLIKKADSGDVNAMYEVGKLYYYGQHVQPNAEYAVHYVKAAADGGNGDACLMFFLMLKNGQGIQQDLQNAFKYFKAAVDKKTASSYVRTWFSLSTRNWLPTKYGRSGEKL